jgi:dihydrofolate reductase
MLYISMSVDGFIATNDDDLSWLSLVEQEGEDYGYTAFNETVDTYIVGRKTYKKVLELTGGVFPQAEVHKCYIVSRSEREDENGVSFTNNVAELVKELKQANGKNIYCDGGSEIVKLLTDADLIDEYIISVIPILLGSGKRLFKGESATQNVSWVSSKSYEKGLVQLHYVRER